MLSRLASYLLRGAASGAEDGEASAQTDAARPETGVAPTPVEARLRQVEVEGDDWILIDRNVEGYAGMDESWYVTPPACFTQPGPVHVETSPLEDLLIEHPSMSVYRAARPPSGPADKPEAAAAAKATGAVPKQRSAKRRPPIGEPVKPAGAGNPPPASTATATTTAAGVRLPLSPRSNVGEGALLETVKKPGRPGSHNHHHHNHHHGGANAAVAEQAPRRSSIRDLRNARGDENVRIVQIRSAQKMLEKRASQSAKRNRLERGNKAREVSSGKGRRPRRQDRLRLNNSGANNNRKC